MKPYFEGWYYKQQANNHTLAIIPGRSSTGAFIQVITDTESFYIPFKLSEYKKSNVLMVGSNKFSNNRISLNIKRKNISIFGELQYSNLTPIKGDIMGPFRFLAMECLHGIISMKHEVSGEISLNGKKLSFEKGTGYIETDKGCSFPESYSWVQSNDFKENCSIMASVAKIPFAGQYFWGCICVVWLAGTEYRLATYKGAKILRCEQGVIELKQGNYHFCMRVSQRNARRLAAPKYGSMSRTIRESASCPAKFVLDYGGNIIFKGENKCTGYEYMF